MPAEGDRSSELGAVESNLSVPNDTHNPEKDSPSNDPELGVVDRPSLSQIRSHISTISQHDIHTAAAEGTYVEPDAAQYTRFSPQRKILITVICSICSLLTPISSTSILSALPEVAAEYHSTGSIIDVSNALYMLFMGLSPSVYGPLSQVYGRRIICIICGAMFFAFSIGTALAPNLPAYFIFRMLTAFQGTSFLVVGTAIIGDIYTPTERGTALGWFLSGTLIGPAFGPFLGGVIVTFCTWRDIFWLQTALGGFALVLVVFFLPETILHMKKDDFVGLPRAKKARRIWHAINPSRIVALLFEYPNLLTTSAGTSALLWNMYSILTPIRYVLNPRFNLTSPIQSGLFYIAPGCGYLLGTFLGGRWADHIVKKWIKKKGRRIPEDRLRSCVPFLGIVIPGCMLIYGWSVDKAVGGIPVPVLAMFVQGVAQLFCFPSLNTYCLDVMQSKNRSAEVVASNYILRYLFAAAGSAAVLPAIERIGVGWFSTISAIFLVFSAGLVVLTIWYGEAWRDKVDERKRAKRLHREEKKNADHQQEEKSSDQAAQGVKQAKT